MASLEFMEDCQSPSTNQQGQQQSQHLLQPESALAISTSSTSTLQTGSSRHGADQKEENSALSPAAPALVHLPLCRQTSSVPGLRYRNLGKSGLRISNVGLGRPF